ncbi:MAG: nucleotidyl transferase AbiEii/AbiGii toxin family protein [Bacteroidetes bacterium]|nr:nucleotidyl transferase AbiEii/AbiGii toxin family protein [Bacteroidota bacterium]MBU1116660.1 nucleotidyl transferase AbiEii/AbiGii toxin family protein [Bacteroidota bacterium]MBU1797489.1 nucleotidyl transferase AbiEii/AbiGii toxin family protein [Bacteroidota bacterium]
MINKKSLEIEWINKVSIANRNADKILVEKVIRALLLLEGLANQNIDFVFKGGSAVMLLLDSSKRLSIDINIILPKIPDNFDELLDNITKEQDFTRVLLKEEQPEAENKKIHYQFFYQPVHKTHEAEERILLDVHFEDVKYSKVIEQPILSSFILEKGEPLSISVPSIEDILGEKLTAFAPNTIGIPYYADGKSMNLQIIKQLYDIGNLVDDSMNLDIVKKTFIIFAKTEIESSNNKLSTDDVLEDIFQTSLCIATRGMAGNGNFEELLKGIQRVSPFIFSEPFHIDKVITSASKAAYVAMLIKYNAKLVEKYINDLQVKEWIITEPLNTKLNKLKKSNPEAFFYWFKIYELMV